jgi:hypothetical protein
VKIRALDSDGDWIFGQGKASYLVGLSAVIEDISTALNTFMGECFWDLGFGVDYFNLAGAKVEVMQQNLILQCRKMIATRQGVTRVVSVESTFNRTRRSFTIKYTVNTVYGPGTQTITKGFTN